MKRYLSLVSIWTEKERVLRENYAPWQVIYRKKWNLEPINSKTPNLIKVGEKKNLIC